MTIKWRYRCIVLLGYLFFCCSNTCTQSRIIDYTRDGDKAFDQLSHSIKVTHVRLQIDAHIDHEQIRSLMQLPEGTITCADLAQACFYLKQSGRFSAIQLLLDPVKNGMSLTVHLSAHWLFERLAISGVWFDKDEVRKRYGLSVGEPFDADKHAQSLKRLLKYYHKNGYLNATITDIITRDTQSKLINVALHINTGSRCTVQQVLVVCKAASSTRHYPWLETMRVYAQHALLHRTYKKHRIKQTVIYMREWLAQHGFPFACVRAHHTHTGVVTFSIEIAQSSRVTFVGNRALSSEQLITYALHDNGRLLEIAMPLFAHRIDELYKKHGYLLVRVTPKHQQHWVLMINEGFPVHFEHVQLLGVHQLRMPYMPALTAALTHKTIATQDDIDALMDKIVAWYTVRGFWDVRIDDKRIIVDDKKKYVMQLTIHEGEQRMLKATHIVGHPALEQRCPFVRVHGKRPLPFNRAILDEQRGWLAKQLTKDGVSVRALVPTVHEQSDGVVIDWHVHGENRQAVFGRPVVTGMPRVAIQRLLRDCVYREGEQFDMRLLEKTFYRLREWGIFSELSVRPSLQLDHRGHTPVMIHAVADDPFELQARIGGLVGNSNRSSTYILGATAWWKNTTGHADSMRLEVNATRFDRDVLWGYGFPELAGLPLRLTVDLFDKKYDHVSYGQCRRTLYRALESGGRVGMVYRHGSFVAGLSLGGAALKINVIDDAYARAICFEPRLSNCREPYIFIDPYIEWNYTDEKLNPSAGMVGAAKATIGIPMHCRSDTFTRLLVKQSVFIPCGSRVVAALHGQIGHVFINSFKRLLPSQRFYLGGACSVRSYQGQAADPVACYCEDHLKFFVPIGSASMGLLSAELRIAITPKIGVVLFQDFGGLKQPADTYWCPSSATGFGVRYRTPVGPLRFDIAWKAKQSAADCLPFAWFLTLGHAF